MIRNFWAILAFAFSLEAGADNVEYFIKLTCMPEIDHFNIHAFSVNFSGDLTDKDYKGLSSIGVFPIYNSFDFSCKLKNSEFAISSKPKDGDDNKYLKPGALISVSRNGERIINSAWLGTISFGTPYITSLSVNEGSTTGYIEVTGSLKEGSIFSEAIMFNFKRDDAIKKYERTW